MSDRMNPDSPNKNAARVFLVDKYICNYIATTWLSDGLSGREQARRLGVHPNLILKIKDVDGYKLPVSTLATMCFYKGISLEEFFRVINEKYGEKINDDFVAKK
jgi:hypothetical protein